MAYGNKFHKVMGYETHHLPHTSPKRVRNKNNNKQENDDFELSFNFNLAHFIAFTLSIYMIQFASIPAIIMMTFIVLSASKIETKK